ncbi:23S rRNA (uracil(1939)-C(5))-methyltransferase RlmD [Mycoplasma simbae]|uniref:23S rRNA (uracil(1939)-C(5))-methyltransferase RlmD n=1 Tax=Mycoplasma simbae TaxID=36744 RepID=UPI0004962585|nr:23S rRNA (uracil(1939)-C(5))-methyltransferase RlmD [Mycoplasma simbae]
MKYAQGQIINNVKAEQLSFEGLGVVKADNYSIFVENLLPGESADIKIKKANSKFAFATVENRHTTSNKRISIANEKLMLTGSTSIAMLSYEDQLEFKQNFVEYLFGRNIHFEKVNKILPSPQKWHYRNKLTVFCKVVDNKVKLGLFAKNTHDLIHQDSYDLAHPQINNAILAFENIVNKNNHFIDNFKFVHSVTFRYSLFENKLLIIINSAKNIALFSNFIELIQQNIHITKNIIINIEAKKPFSRKLLNSPASLTDYIGDTLISYNWNSFFQVNSLQTNNLYNLLIDNLALNKENVVIDAYSGAGSISLKIAPKVKKVIGLELVNEAVENAKNNATKNGIKNASFYAGDVNKTILNVSETIDVVIVDPPRSGMSEDFIQSVVKLSPQKIGYISCNVHTMCRDIDYLQNNGYKLRFLQPCDMFAQTHHIEAVGVLEKNV